MQLTTTDGYEIQSKMTELRFWFKRALYVQIVALMPVCLSSTRDKAPALRLVVTTVALQQNPFGAPTLISCETLSISSLMSYLANVPDPFTMKRLSYAGRMEGDPCVYPFGKATPDFREAFRIILSSTLPFARSCEDPP